MWLIDEDVKYTALTAAEYNRIYTADVPRILRRIILCNYSGAFVTWHLDVCTDVPGPETRTRLWFNQYAETDETVHIETSIALAIGNIVFFKPSSASVNLRLEG